MLNGIACYVGDLVSSAPAAPADERRRTSANNPPANDASEVHRPARGQPAAWDRLLCMETRCLELGQNVGPGFLVAEANMSDPIDTVAKAP